MRPVRVFLFACSLASAVALGACGGGRGSSSAVPPARMPTAASVSPASVRAPAMTKAAGPPMAAARRAQGFIQPPAWTQIPGGAVFVTAAPDGSIWVLSTLGIGSGDKFIYHYAGGTWTSIPGAAMRLAVAPDGTLWAVNAAGGIYAYNGGWTTIAGGASDITVGTDGSVYVISSVPGGGPYGNGIWHYAAGGWTQLPGAAVRIAASTDTGTYPGGIVPGGFYVVNALGGIYYYAPGTGFVPLPGAASSVAPTKSGGLFALGRPDGAGNSAIYYYNVAAGVWTTEPGGATSIATDGTTVYVVGVGGGIYSAPVTASTLAVAPVAGYLSVSPTGSLAGQLNNVSSGATLVGISTDEVPGGSTLTQGSLAFGLGGTALSARREAMAAAPEPPGPHGLVDRPAESPADVAAQTAGLRRAGANERRTSSYRRASSLGTTVGATNAFWVSVFSIGSSSGHDVQVPATLQAVTNNTYVWVDDTLNLDAPSIAKLADDAENAYASDTAHFGPTGFTASSPGVANHPGYSACSATGAPLGFAVPTLVVPPDSKINAFIINESALGSGVGGYFTTLNYVPQLALNCGIGTKYTAQTVPHSNEAPLIYAGWYLPNGPSYEADEDLVRGTAHELQHLINYVDHTALHDAPSESAWINEGMSMLAQDLAVNRKFNIPHDTLDALYHARQYTTAPQNFSLTAFTGIDSGQTTPQYNCSGCYGLSYLFQRYLYDRFGGDAYLSAMLGSSTSYTALGQATGVAPQTLLSDFAIALAASGTNATTDPRFGIASLNLTATFIDQFGNYTTVGGPRTTALPSSATPYLGTFSYYALSAAAAGQTVSVKDLGGGFGLQAGVVQR